MSGLSNIYRDPVPYVGARVFRAAPLAVGTALEQLGFDTVSPFSTTQGAEIDVAGDIIVDAGGVAVVTVNVVLDAATLLSGVRLVISRVRGGVPTAIYDVTRFGVVGTDQVAHADAMAAVTIGDLIRVEIAAVGIGTTSLRNDDLATHAYLVVHPPFA